MAGRSWTREEAEILKMLYIKQVAPEQIGVRLKRTRDAILRKAAKSGLVWGSEITAGFTYGSPAPTVSRDIDTLIAQQSERFRAKEDRSNYKKGIDILLRSDEPIGLVLFGDPHVDDDGTDLAHLSSDIKFVKETPGLYAANMGDLTNNWQRVLGHLYAHQHTTEDESIEMLRWIVTSLPWMWVVLGNHDKWSPLAQVMCKERGVRSVSHGAIFNLRFPCGVVCKVDARHTHKGHSQFNPSHGEVKQNFRGSPADIIIGAHTHTGAYTLLKNGVADQIGHCIRVGAYKKYDDYAEANGFPSEALAPSVMCVIDPTRAGEVGFVTVQHDLEIGAIILEGLRKRGKQT